MFDALLYIAAIVFAFYISNELDKAKAPVATPQPEAQPAIAEVQPQPAVEDPWTEPTNVIQFPKFTFTSEIHTFEAEPAVDYSSMTIRELKAIASDRKLKGYSRMTKATLAQALAA